MTSAFGVKTNERPGTRAQVRYVRMSPSKARQVLDLIRNREVAEADQILQFVERDAAIVVRKCRASAVANAEHNDEQTADELFVSACYADEGPTLKRWRPRARGRATRIRKRTCHITVIVSRLSDRELALRAERESAAPGSRAARRAGQQAAEARKARVTRSRQRQEDEAAEDEDDAASTEVEPTGSTDAAMPAEAEIADQDTVAELEADGDAAEAAQSQQGDDDDTRIGEAGAAEAAQSQQSDAAETERSSADDESQMPEATRQGEAADGSNVDDDVNKEDT
ncbi:hypothetical protein BH20ACT2_BH20ACT2_02390 [soil metagenome]